MYYLDLNFDGDRLDLSKYLEPYSDDRDPLTSDFLMQIMDMPKGGEISLSADMENRPDLISYSLYGSTKLWWVVALYNSRIAYDEFKAGDKIKYPDKSQIEEYFFTAQAKIKLEDCLAKRVKGMSDAG
jgi:hypothetical protein